MNQLDILHAEVEAKKIEDEALRLLTDVKSCSKENNLYCLERFTIEISSITLVLNARVDLAPLLENIFEDRLKYGIFWGVAKDIPMDDETVKQFVFKSENGDLENFRTVLGKFIEAIKLVRSQLRIAHWY